MSLALMPSGSVDLSAGGRRFAECMLVGRGAEVLQLLGGSLVPGVEVWAERS